MNPYGYQNNTFMQGGINWVQGEAGARSFYVGPNQTVVLFDSESPVFYFKSADQTGMPQPLRIFDYSERAQKSEKSDMSQYVTKDELKEYIESLMKGDKK